MKFKTTENDLIWEQYSNRGEMDNHAPEEMDIYSKLLKKAKIAANNNQSFPWKREDLRKMVKSEIEVNTIIQIYKDTRERLLSSGKWVHGN